ncbi:hypothetical protein BH23CHL5_BH23CHL5_11400 [soil metagenome]
MKPGEQRESNQSGPERIVSTPRVAVVGPCASGKSTLVANLRRNGVDAHSVAQEHSVIPDLWTHQNPDLLVCLHADLETVKERRGPAWRERVYLDQLERLRNAFAAASVVIDSGIVGEADALNVAMNTVEKWRLECGSSE